MASRRSGIAIPSVRDVGASFGMRRVHRCERTAGHTCSTRTEGVLRESPAIQLTDIVYQGQSLAFRHAEPTCQFPNTSSSRSAVSTRSPQARRRSASAPRTRLRVFGSRRPNFRSSCRRRREASPSCRPFWSPFWSPFWTPRCCPSLSPSLRPSLLESACGAAGGASRRARSRPTPPAAEAHPQGRSRAQRGVVLFGAPAATSF
jgi:hypothetical protein